MAWKDTTKMEREIEMEAQCSPCLTEDIEIQTIYSLTKAVFPLVFRVSSYSIYRQRPVQTAALRAPWEGCIRSSR